MPKLMVHPQLLNLLPATLDAEPSEYTVLPHVISNNFGTFEGPPDFFLIVLDVASAINVVQGSIVLSNAVRNGKQDFPEAGLIISTIKVPMQDNSKLARILSKLWTTHAFSFFSFNNDAELQGFLLCIVSRESRPAPVSAEEIGLRTKHKAAFCSEDTPWVAFLKCIPGVTEKKAEAIAKAYPSIRILLQTYSVLDKKQGKKVLMKVKYGAKQIGEAVSTKVYQALVEQDETVILK